MRADKVYLAVKTTLSYSCNTLVIELSFIESSISRVEQT